MLRASTTVGIERPPAVPLTVAEPVELEEPPQAVEAMASAVMAVTKIVFISRAPFSPRRIREEVAACSTEDRPPGGSITGAVRRVLPRSSRFATEVERLHAGLEPLRR